MSTGSDHFKVNQIHWPLNCFLTCHWLIMLILDFVKRLLNRLLHHTLCTYFNPRAAKHFTGYAGRRSATGSYIRAVRRFAGYAGRRWASTSSTRAIGSFIGYAYNCFHKQFISKALINFYSLNSINVIFYLFENS